MKKYLLCLSLALSICLGGNALGGAWNGGGGSANLWSNGDNWSTGSPPAAGEDVFVDWGTTSVANPVLIDSTVTGYGAILRVGGGAPSSEYISMTGGSLTLSGHLILGQGNGSTADFEMSGGVLTANSIWSGSMTSWGMGARGTLTMTDGTVILNGEGLYVSRDGSAGALGVDLKGGLIDAASYFMGAGGSMNIDTGGILRLPDTFEGRVNDYITAGTLTGDGVVGNVGVVNNGDGTIDVMAIPEPATMLLLGLGGLLMSRRKRT